MGKVKTFAAKVAHELSDEGKTICPVCKVPSWKFEQVEGR